MMRPTQSQSLRTSEPQETSKLSERGRSLRLGSDRTGATKRTRRVLVVDMDAGSFVFS